MLLRLWIDRVILATVKLSDLSVMTEAQASLEIPENVSFALKILLPEQRQQVYDFVEFLLQKQQIANSQQQQQTERVGLRQITTERILGLHQGQGSISDDFAKPLPDESWDLD